MSKESYLADESPKSGETHQKYLDIIRDLYKPMKKKKKPDEEDRQ
jgi:hypothetical protein